MNAENVSQYAYVILIIRQIPKYICVCSSNKYLQYLINSYTFFPTSIKAAQSTIIFSNIVLVTLHDYRSDYLVDEIFFSHFASYESDSRTPPCGNRESCAKLLFTGAFITRRRYTIKI